MWSVDVVYTWLLHNEVSYSSHLCSFWLTHLCFMVKFVAVPIFFNIVITCTYKGGNHLKIVCGVYNALKIYLTLNGLTIIVIRERD